MISSPRWRYRDLWKHTVQVSSNHYILYGKSAFIHIMVNPSWMVSPQACFFTTRSCAVSSWKNLPLELNDLAQSDGNNAHSDETSDYVNVKQLPKNLLLLDESQNFFLSAYWDEPSKICKKRASFGHKVRSYGIWMTLGSNLTTFAKTTFVWGCRISLSVCLGTWQA